MTTTARSASDRATDSTAANAVSARTAHAVRATPRPLDLQRQANPYHAAKHGGRKIVDQSLSRFLIGPRGPWSGFPGLTVGNWPAVPAPSGQAGGQGQSVDRLSPSRPS